MKQLTALNWVMRDIEQNYPNLFDLNTAQGREFVSRFHKYLEMEKEQIIDAATCGALQETGEKYYNETYKKDNP